MDPAFAVAHLKLGVMYEEKGDYSKAAAELQRAVELDPENVTAHYRLAQCYRRNGQTAQADLELEEFKKKHSEPPKEDTTEEDLRAFTARLARELPHAAPCHAPQ